MWLRLPVLSGNAGTAEDSTPFNVSAFQDVSPEAWMSGRVAPWLSAWEFGHVCTDKNTFIVGGKI